MAIRSHPIVCSFRRLAPNFSKGSRGQAETGITLIELVVAISVMGFVALGALAFVQLGASAKRAVGKEIRYSQELSLMSAQIIGRGRSAIPGACVRLQMSVRGRNMAVSAILLSTRILRLPIRSITGQTAVCFTDLKEHYLPSKLDW